MKKPLSHFRHANRETIAKLDGMKSIMEVITDRQWSWWLVLPAIGEADGVCVLLAKEWRRSGSYRQTRERILAEYADRITA